MFLPVDWSHFCAVIYWSNNKWTSAESSNSTFHVEILNNARKSRHAILQFAASEKLKLRMYVVRIVHMGTAVSVQCAKVWRLVRTMA